MRICFNALYCICKLCLKMRQNHLIKSSLTHLFPQRCTLLNRNNLTMYFKIKKYHLFRCLELFRVSTVAQNVFHYYKLLYYLDSVYYYADLTILFEFATNIVFYRIEVILFYKYLYKHSLCPW